MNIIETSWNDIPAVSSRSLLSIRDTMKEEDAGEIFTWHNMY